MNLSFFRRLIFKNLPYKISAFILSIVLWLFISKEKDLEIGVKAKLFIKTKTGLVVSGDVPDEINIRLSGPKIYLQPLLLRQFEPIHVDLSHFDEGETTFNILESMIHIPLGVRMGVKIVSISPSSIVARIEKIATKTVPIRAQFADEPPLGFSVKSQKLEPDVVEISGPKAEVNTIRYINTKPISFQNVTESFTKSFSLDIPSPKIVIKDTKMVYVSIAISENITKKSFSNLKLEVHNCIFRCKVSPSFISVILKGPKKLLSKLKNKDIQVYIDAGSRPKGNYQNLKAGIKLPARTTVEKVTPILFRLTVF